MIRVSLSGGEEVGCHGSLQHGSLHTCFYLEFGSPISAYLYCVGICPFGVFFFILIKGLSTEKCTICDGGLVRRSAAVPDAEAGVNPLCHH